MIRDFEPTQDRLRIDTTIGGVSTIGAPTLALQTAANGTDVEVVVNGVTAILLEGVTISDALAASIVTVPPQAGAPITPPPDFNPITGTDNDDVLEGTSGPDEMNGGAGNDRVNGNDGNDIIISTAGENVLSGGNGDDVLNAINGGDVLQGDAGNDVIISDGAGDFLIGGQGNDLLDVTRERAVGGGALLDGGDGADTLIGAPLDQMTGGAGGDQFTVKTYLGSAGDLALITDFDPAIDRLALDYTSGSTPPSVTAPEITLQAYTDPLGDGVEVLLDGVAYVRLAGATVSPALTAAIIRA